MPSVSVIIPTYNRAHLVGEAIQSVQDQTFTDLELIVVDDGSTDHTEEVVRSFTDLRLKYLKRPNGGVSAARNTGLEACAGEFVAFLDSDDLFLPEKLALQVAKISTDPEVGLVYGRYYTAVAEESPRKVAGRCYPQLELRDLLLGPMFHWSTVLVRRSYLDEIGEFDEQFRVGEEWELTLRLALAGCKMICVPEPLNVVRIQPISLSRDVHHYSLDAKRVLDKTFSNPRMPAELTELQGKAYAAQIIRSAGSAYLGPSPESGRDILEQALASYPALANEEIDLLVGKLVKYTVGLSLYDPHQTLADITAHLPGGKPFSKKLKRRLWGRFYLEGAFKAYMLSQWSKCGNYALRAIVHTPSCLRNRGLVSILFRSLLGNWFGDTPKNMQVENHE
jgi:glycosyltransferase involved in cell wall biosynthesis